MEMISVGLKAEPNEPDETEEGEWGGLVPRTRVSKGS